MKTKIESPLMAKEVSFKFNDRADIKKNKDFRKTMESYNKDNIEKSNVKEKNKTHKHKTNEKTQKKEKTQPNNVDEKEANIVDENENSDKKQENQIYLEFLFEGSNKLYNDVEIEKNLESKLNEELKLTSEINETLNLSKEDVISLDKRMKEINLKKQGLNLKEESIDESSKSIEKENTDKVNINLKDSKQDSQVDVDGNNITKSQKSLKSLDITKSNEQKQNEEMKNISLEKVDSDNISMKVDETEKGDKNLKKANIESEELDTIKSETDLKGESFLVHKKEVSFNKNTNIETNKPEPVDVKKTIQQISEHMKFSINNNKNQIKISLKPETLGEMAMEIEVIEGSLTAKVIVDNQKTKEIIQNNLFQLKDEIKDTGLEIKSFEVFVGNGNDFSKNGSRQFNFNKFNKKNHNNLRIKKASNENEGTGYNDPMIDGINNSSNIYENGSLNLLA